MGFVEQAIGFVEGWWSKQISFLKVSGATNLGLWRVGGASKWGGLWSKQLGLLKVGGASKLVF
jgi:hypothetical protein